MRAFSIERNGWNSKVAGPFRLLEQLPDHLKREGTNKWSGESDRYQFRLLLKPRRFELSTLDLVSRRTETHLYQTQGMSDLSPLNLVVQLVERLDQERNAEEVFIGDIISRLHLLRNSSDLAIEPFEASPSSKAVAAGRFLCENAKLGDLTLKLSTPFELWSEEVSDECPVWAGYELPKALAELTPTTTMVFREDRLIDMSVGSVSFGQSDDLEENFVATDLSEAELDELESLSTQLQECLSRLR